MKLLYPRSQHLVGNGTFRGYEELAVCAPFQPHLGVAIDEGQGVADVRGVKPSDVLNLAAEVVNGWHRPVVGIGVDQAPHHQAPGRERPVLGVEDLAGRVRQELNSALLGNLSLKTIKQCLANIHKSGNARVHAFGVLWVSLK